MQIDKKNVEDLYPLSSAQLGILYSFIKFPESKFYFEQLVLNLKNEIDDQCFEKALKETVNSNEVLRTIFRWEKISNPVQIVSKNVKVDFRKINLVNDTNKFNEVSKILAGDKEEYFNLSNVPFRVYLIKLDRSEFKLVISFHHILMDGWSSALLLNEIFQVYGKILKGKITSNTIKTKYKEFIKIQKKTDYSSHKSFWKDYLKNLSSPISLSLNSESVDNLNNQIKKVFPNILSDKIRSFASKYKVATSSIFYGSLAIFLHKYLNADDILIGTPVSGRNVRVKGIEKIIGLFFNTIPLRSKLNHDQNCIDFCIKLNDSLNNRKEYENTPVEIIRNSNSLKNKINWLNIIMSIQNYPLLNKNAENNGFKIDSFQIVENINSELFIEVFTNDNFEIVFTYKKNLFGEELINNFVSDFENVINAIVADEEIKINEIEIASAKVFNKTEKTEDVLISSTFTSEPVEKYIDFWLKQIGSKLKVGFTSYNQVFQQLTDNNSKLSHNSGINILMLRFEDWLREDVTSVNTVIDNAEKIYVDFISILEQKELTIPYLVLLIPVSSAYKYDKKIINHLESINERIYNNSLEKKNLFAVDINKSLELYNTTDIFDEVSNSEGHIPFTEEAFSAIGTIVSRSINSILYSSFKVIVVDCDNTLWKGICGEDGSEGVKVTKDYVKFQNFLLKKRNEGFLLVLCSKNNENDVFDVFEKNQGMVLKKEHIVTWKINWEPKSENIIQIAKELNLGLDSFIFIDDSQLECSEVINSIPEILTIQFPAELSDIMNYFNQIWAFDKPVVTDEDKRRSEMYKTELKRKNAQKKGKELEGFLKESQIKVKINLIKEKNLDRATQLTQRTNQFNSSGIRKTRSELYNYIQDKNALCWMINVEDRFGSYGDTGVVVAKKENKNLYVEIFLLSCRVLGRKVEYKVILELQEYSCVNDIDNVIIKYIKRDRNIPINEFLENVHHQKEKKHDCVDYIISSLNKIYNPDYISLERISEDTTQIENSNNIIPSNHTETINDNVNENVKKVPEIKKESKQTGLNIYNDYPYISLGEKLKLHKIQYLALELNSSQKIVSYFAKTESKKIKEEGTIKPGQSNLEIKLIKIYEDVLNIKGVGLNHCFFQLGGNSFKGIQLLSRIHKEFGIKITIEDLFEYSEIDKLAIFLSNKKSEEFVRILPTEKKEYYYLSSVQKRLYFLQMFDKTSTSYNMPFVVKLIGDINKNKIEKIFKDIIKRHEGFQYSFILSNDVPLLKKNFDKYFGLQYDEIKKENVNVAISNFIKPFNLEEGGLICVGLFKLSPDEYILIIDMHHIISDGVSQELLIEDFIALYNNEELPKKSIQFKDYSEWQKREIASTKYIEQKEFWLKEFSDNVPVLNIPTDFSRTINHNNKGKNQLIVINKETTVGLKKIAVETGTTLYMLLLASYNVLLSKLTKSEDIVVGAPVSQRHHYDLDNIIGPFLNTLAFRNQPNKEKSFLDFLYEVRINTLKAYENTDYPFEELVDNLRLNRNTDKNPLFDTFFNMLNYNSDHDYRLEDFTLTVFPIEEVHAKFDLSFYITENTDEIQIKCLYRTSLFKETTIDYILSEFTKLLNQVALNPKRKIQDYNTFDLASYNDYNASEEQEKFVEQLPNQNIVQGFEEQVRNNGAKLAVKHLNKELTYKELNHKATCVANEIIDKVNLRGSELVGNKDAIALLFNHSLDMIFGILGTLKAGKYYVPLVPDYSAERLYEIVKDSDTSIIVTDDSNYNLTCSINKYLNNRIEIINISKLNYDKETIELNIKIDPKQIAYIIYTSGSTGKPKGIIQDNRTVLENIWKYTSRFGVNKQDKTTLIPYYNHDASVVDIFSALLNGASLFITDIKVLDAEDLASYIKKEGITIFHSVPSFYRHFISEVNDIDKLKSLRLIVLGGEKVGNSDLLLFQNKLDTKCVFANLYGSSELSIMSIKTFIKDSKLSNFVSIGNISENKDEILVLNDQKELVRIFEKGELYYKCKYTPLGYKNLQGLTSQAFVRLNGNFYYKTGDIVRINIDGEIEFIGRNDSQIKLRGYRVEIGEIENRLINHKNITDAVIVINHKGDEKFLVAYYISLEELTIKELSSYLLQTLPDYMIPSFFVKIEKMPKLPNGKVNRRMLPDFENKKKGNELLNGNLNITEEKVRKIWAEVLKVNVPDIDINLSFFEQGGHSLKAMAVVNNINKEFAVKIALKQFFNASDIRELGKVIDSANHELTSIINKSEYKEYYELSSPQKRIYFNYSFNKESLAYNMIHAIQIEGLIDLSKLEKTFNMLIRRYESLRTSFHIVNNKPVQKIEKDVRFQIEYFEGLNNEQQIIKDFIKPFNLKRAPLLRVGLIEISKEKYLLLFDIHHIISDGTSQGILIKDLISLYNDEELVEPKIHYKDYTEWLYGEKSIDNRINQKEYWIEKYSSEIKRVELPIDFKRPAINNNEGQRLWFELNKEETTILKDLASKNGTTIFVVLFSIYNILISKLGNTEDVIIGTPAAGRTQPDLDKITGMFINILSVRNFPKGKLSFVDFLKEVKLNIESCFSNQDYQYEELIEELRTNNGFKGNQLFDVAFTFQNFEKYEIEIPRLKFTPYNSKLEDMACKYDLGLVANENNDCISFCFEYYSKIFKDETIKKIRDYFFSIINLIINEPNISLEDIETMNEQNKSQQDNLNLELEVDFNL